MTDVTRIWAVVLRSARKCTRCMRLQRLHSSAMERPGVHLACQQTNCQDSTADGNYDKEHLDAMHELQVLVAVRATSSC